MMVVEYVENTNLQNYLELEKQFKKYGKCEKCYKVNTWEDWCKSCNSKRFQQNFNNWTSDNEGIDEFIQKKLSYQQITNLRY